MINLVDVHLNRCSKCKREATLYISTDSECVIICSGNDNPYVRCNNMSEIFNRAEDAVNDWNMKNKETD